MKVIVMWNNRKRYNIRKICNSNNRNNNMKVVEKSKKKMRKYRR